MILGFILGIAATVWALGAAAIFVFMSGLGGADWRLMLFWPVLVPYALVRTLLE